MSPPISPHAQDTYTKLVELLDQRGAQYRLIHHQEEGRCDAVSALRGHDLSQAAKCMILMVKIGKKDKRFVLAVVPGNEEIDFNAVKDLFRGTKVLFAPKDIAEKLAGSVVGTILPFSFSEELILIVDPCIKERESIYFNAARFDRSIELKISDYLKIASPRFERIIESDNVQHLGSSSKS